jgi:hypothetical protein
MSEITGQVEDVGKLTRKVNPFAMVGQLLEDVVFLNLVGGKVRRHINKSGQAPRC